MTLAATKPHPLAPLTALEVDRMRGVLVEAGEVQPTTRFSYVRLREPAKAELADGQELPRQAEVLLTDLANGSSADFIVDLTAGRIARRTQYRLPEDGTGPMFDEEYFEAEKLVKADPTWRAAMTKRGVTDFDQLRVVALAPGVFDFGGEENVRVSRAITYLQDYPTDSVWGHPVGGVVAHLDMTNGRVLRVIETDVEHIPTESANYDLEEVRGPLRETQRPIEITQPEGVSFTLEDGQLRWENWDLRVGFNGREGLTLHQIGFSDKGRRRSIIHRASIAEMVVNYGDPTPIHSWQNYFDVGEVQFGRWANSLELGCDCLGEIRYLDVVVVNDDGTPRTIKNAICIHEEDASILWKHNDVFSGSDETRRQRRLVVSSFLTVGNYDYGFYWHFYLDGAIELEVKATGIVLTSGHPGGDYPYAPELAPGVGAPVHQHLLSARLDFAIDGSANAVDEIEFHTTPMGDGNPLGNAFERSVTRLATERAAVRDADPVRGRVWRISSAEARNRMGHPTAYTLHPEGKPTLLAHPDSSSRARAGFAAHHLWVTRFDQEESWSAGRLVNQHPGRGGLPTYVEADRSIDGADIVVWHTFGLTHHPRLEDYPVMPVDKTGFRLTPDGFFDANPTLDVPPPKRHCH